MKSLKELTQERADRVAGARKLLDTADAESRDLSVDERQTYDRIEKEIEEISDQIEGRLATADRKERHARIDAMLSADSLGRQTPPSRPGSTAGTAGAALTWDFGRAGKLSIQDLDTDEDAPLIQRLRDRSSPRYCGAFRSYLKGKPGNWERLGLQVANDPKGGYLVPMDFLSQLIKFLDDAVTIRQLGTVLPPTTAKSVGLLSFDTDYGDSDWTAEVPASDISEDDAARFGGREMTPHLLSKHVRTSRKLLRGSTIPLETFLAQRLAYRFAITENKAFLSGTGVQRPLGAWTAHADGVTTARDTTCASTTAFTADELIDLKESLKDVYQMNSTWIVSREFRKRARKLKGGDGHYLLTENNAGGLTTLLERPLRVDENAPSTFTTGQYVAMIADWSFYYIQDGIDMELQRLDELHALRNQVGWIARKETDGMPVLAEAFARLKLA